MVGYCITNEPSLVVISVIVSVVVGILLLAGGNWSSKMFKTPSFQIGSGWNLAGLFLEEIRINWQSWIFDLTSALMAITSFHAWIIKCCYLVSEKEMFAVGQCMPVSDL